MASTLADRFLQDLEELSEEEQALVETETETEPEPDDSGEAAFLEEIRTAHGQSEASRLVVRGSDWLEKLDLRIRSCHGKLKTMYAKWFPELERLVRNAVDFARVVLVVRDGKDRAAQEISEALEKILTPATLMVVQMTFSTTMASVEANMTEMEFERIRAAAQEILELAERRREILRFVEQRMGEIAPNLSVLVGNQVAANLIGATGGIEALSKTPACNIPSIRDTGAEIKNSGGNEKGIIYRCDLVEKAPAQLKRKIVKLLAGKVALSARMDLLKGAVDGAQGSEFREHVEKMLSKLQEPPPKKMKKPLPAPIDKAKKRRGGKKYRKMKEKFKITELSRMKNRMAFGTEEQEDYITGASLGLLGADIGSSTGTGSVRVVAEDNQKLGKAAQRKLLKAQQARAGGFQTAIQSGIATSLALEGTHGIELANPENIGSSSTRKEALYFSATSGFQSSLPK